jgi:hypothetical protein
MATELKFYGISETLYYLKNYEKDLFDSLRKDLVNASQPLATLVGSKFPDEPLLNWHTSGGRLSSKSRLPAYNGAVAKKSVKPKAGTGSIRGGTRNNVILRIQQNDAGGSVYDIAGSRTKGARGAGATAGQKFIANLDKTKSIQSQGNGGRSRILYGVVKANEKMIEQDILVVIKKVDAHTTKAILSNQK